MLTRDEARAMLEDEPDSWLSHWTCGFALDASGQYEEAATILQRAVELSNRLIYPVAALAAAYARLGREAEARGLLNELLTRSGTTTILHSYIAMIYTALDDFDSAFAQIDEAMRQRDNGVMILHLFHYFDPLRADPRYREVFARIRSARRG